MSGLDDGSRIVVAGNATAEELAAVVLALDRALTKPALPRRRPGWQEAARYEAVGTGIFRSPTDLPRP